MVACARFLEKRVLEPWSSRISLPEDGEKTSDQMTVVICGVRTVSEVQVQYYYIRIWREEERVKKILVKITFEMDTEVFAGVDSGL